MDERRYNANLRMLHILLVCSFINTGLSMLSELVSGISLPWMRQYIDAHPNMVPDEWGIILERAFSIHRWYYLLTALLDAVSIFGLVLMWKLRKNGFHTYALSKLILMLLPLLFLDRSYVGIGNIMIGALMIVYYLFLMRALGVFTSDRASSSPTA